MNPADDYVRRSTEDTPRSKVLRACTVAVPAHIPRPGDSASSVRTALRATGTDHTVVCHPDGSPAGVATLSELSRPGGAAASMEQAMRVDFRTVRPDTLLDEVLGMLASSPAPVALVDHRGSLQGSISRGDALRALVGTGTSTP
ncbi:CBS domain-containing protein [Mycolicibacterium fluoranthenivorans]|nr:CBS domain-containing protein [Mycolicibacterium fluoranthenivorans]QNJ94792.1 CBS domain-containing protein [Mycolicibacterium fluoranthenivorans]